MSGSSHLQGQIYNGSRGFVRTALSLDTSVQNLVIQVNEAKAAAAAGLVS